jgi:predicted dehydrogenase
VRTLKIAIIGCGGVTLQNHLPGLALCPHVTVTALCDTDAATLERARQASGVVVTSNRYEEIVSRDDVHAVIIATPNVTHGPIAVAAFAHGKHVLCEKPLALAHAEAKAMADAGDRAGVRHMTAFTYRFVPAMRYLAHLVRRGDLGEPYHYRSCRLQDWGTRDLGWRQVKPLAGTGELGDMLSHRIDFAHLLYGPMRRLVAGVKHWHPVRGGRANDLDDWVVTGVARFVALARMLMPVAEIVENPVAYALVAPAMIAFEVSDATPTKPPATDVVEGASVALEPAETRTLPLAVSVALWM